MRGWGAESAACAEGGHRRCHWVQRVLRAHTPPCARVERVAPPRLNASCAGALAASALCTPSPPILVVPPPHPLQVINNCAMGGSLVAGILTGDAALIGKALDSDAIVEPVRGPLIPGFQAVKEAAHAAGAVGGWVGGGGPGAGEWGATLADSMRKTGWQVLRAGGYRLTRAFLGGSL